jgi:hypothetical protein
LLITLVKNLVNYVWKCEIIIDFVFFYPVYASIWDAVQLEILQFSAVEQQMNEIEVVSLDNEMVVTGFCSSAMKYFLL